MNALYLILFSSFLLAVAFSEEDDITRDDYEKVGRRLSDDLPVEAEGDWDMNMQYLNDLLEKEAKKPEAEQDKGYLGALKLMAPLGRMGPANICEPHNRQVLMENKRLTIDKRNWGDLVNGDGRAVTIIIHYLKMHKYYCEENHKDDDKNPLARFGDFLKNFGKKNGE